MRGLFFFSFFPAGVKAWPGVCERKQVSSSSSSSGPDGVTAPEARACLSCSALLSGHRGPFFLLSLLHPPLAPATHDFIPLRFFAVRRRVVLSFCRWDTVFFLCSWCEALSSGRFGLSPAAGTLLAGPGGADGLSSLEHRPPLCLCLVSALWK